MRCIKIIGLCLGVVLATGALAAASASAAAPEFLPACTLCGFTGKSSGPVVINDHVAAIEIKCSKEEIKEGTIEPGSTKRVEEVRIKFRPCSAYVNKTKCSVHSPGELAGYLKLKLLRGELGKVAPAEAASETGLNLEPESGTLLVKVEGTCIHPLELKGSIIGEVTPLHVTAGIKLVSALTGFAQSIQKFEPPGTVDTLEAFPNEVTLRSSVNLKFAEPIEVT